MDENSFVKSFLTAEMLHFVSRIFKNTDVGAIWTMTFRRKNNQETGQPKNLITAAC